MNQVLYTQTLRIGYQRLRYADLVVADKLNLSLCAGELVCLLGPNGAGKSTLMRTLTGMQKPLAGRVILGDDALSKLSPRELAKRMSIVLTERPDLGLLNGYALVALGRHPHTSWLGQLSRYDEAMIHWAIDAVGASDLAEYPVMQLSDGQRQKIMIARALAQETDVIMLDEPTAFLDLPRRVEIMQLLRHLAAETGRAILLSTHDLQLALQSADKLWLMSNGAIQLGTPEDLVLNGAFEAAFHSEGVQFDKATGAFKMAQPMRQVVAVRGEGIPHTWTRHALQRAGFELSHNGHMPAVEIHIKTHNQQPVWHVQQNGHHNVANSISDMLDILASASIGET